MPQSFKLVFASSNKNKYSEVKKILNGLGIDIGFFQSSLTEIQADTLKEIAKRKAIDAYRKCKKPVIIEDDGLFIDGLNGFPGPFSSYVFKTIGNKGILKLIKSNRKSSFQSVIAYCDKNTNPIVFQASVLGKISQRLRGNGWGYDPIFIPVGKSRTFAEISNKNKLSHRYLALVKFANWYLNKRVSIYR